MAEERNRILNGIRFQLHFANSKDRRDVVWGLYLATLVVAKSAPDVSNDE